MPADPPQIVDVALAAVVRTGAQAGPRVLITRRTAEQVYAGYWELPGGKCEAGETPAQCVVRELSEEVNLAVTPVQALPTIEHRYDHAHVRLHSWLCHCQAPETATLREVAALRWVGPGELDQYAFPEANVPLIAQLQARLNAPDTLPLPE
jgi:mutator protein MutT